MRLKVDFLLIDHTSVLSACFFPRKRMRLRPEVMVPHSSLPRSSACVQQRSRLTAVRKVWVSSSTAPLRRPMTGLSIPKSVNVPVSRPSVSVQVSVPRRSPSCPSSTTSYRSAIRHPSFALPKRSLPDEASRRQRSTAPFVSEL